MNSGALYPDTNTMLNAVQRALDAAAKCCEWCTRMAGRYRYGEEPEDVYRRHDNCSCTVTYESGRQRQDVWSKRTWEAPDKDAGAEKTTVFSQEQAQTLQDENGLTYGKKPAIIKLPDIEIGRSVGAKAKNYDIMDLATGEIFHLVEGTRLHDVEVFAGKGTRTTFRDAEKYAERYGGDPENWQHTKGFGTVDYYGDEIEAELHWVQCEGIGKFEFFVKRWFE